MPKAIKHVFSSFTFIWYAGCFLIVQILTLWIAYDMNAMNAVYLDMKDRWCVRSADWIATQTQHFTPPANAELDESQRQMLIKYTEMFDSWANVYARLIDEKGQLVCTPVKSQSTDGHMNSKLEADIDFAFFAGSSTDRPIPSSKTVIHSRPITGTRYTFLIGALPSNSGRIPVSLILASIVFQAMMISVTALAVRRKTLLDSLQNRIDFLEDENHRLYKKIKRTCHIPTDGSHRLERHHHPLSSIIPDVDFDDITDSRIIPPSSKTNA